MVWWVRFRALATVHRFVLALSDKDEVDLPDKEEEVLDENDVEGKKKIAARKRNAVAMANYSMAFSCESNLGMIFNSITPNWPT
jgi:hypothetical protein